MGCSPSSEARTAPAHSGSSSPERKWRQSTLQIQYQLMRLAQSNGLFCDGKRALDLIKANPGRSTEELLDMIQGDLDPLPLMAPPRDPRTLSPEEALARADEVAASRSSGGAGCKPISLETLEALAPKTLCAVVPQALKDNVETGELCAICTCAILSTSTRDGSAEEVPIRQLECSHAFHAACIDPWLTEQDGSCPICRRGVAHTSDGDDQRPAVSGYARWQEAQASGIERELRRHAEAREGEWSRVAAEEREAAARRQVGLAIAMF